MLDRFRAILRISELEARARRAGFSTVDLAERRRTGGRALPARWPRTPACALVDRGAAGARIEADPKLLFEAVSNLVDNAIKFTPARRPGAIA